MGEFLNIMGMHEYPNICREDDAYEINPKRFHMRNNIESLEFYYLLGHYEPPGMVSCIRALYIYTIPHFVRMKKTIYFTRILFCIEKLKFYLLSALCKPH